MPQLLVIFLLLSFLANPALAARAKTARDGSGFTVSKCIEKHTQNGMRWKKAMRKCRARQRKMQGSGES